MAGFALAPTIILVNGVLNTYTIHLQALAKEKLGRKVKSFSDLGGECFGFSGQMLIAMAIILN